MNKCFTGGFLLKSKVISRLCPLGGWEVSCPQDFKDAGTISPWSPFASRKPRWKSIDWRGRQSWDRSVPPRQLSPLRCRVHPSLLWRSICHRLCWTQMRLVVTPSLSLQGKAICTPPEHLTPSQSIGRLRAFRESPWSSLGHCSLGKLTVGSNLREQLSLNSNYCFNKTLTNLFYFIHENYKLWQFSEANRCQI